MLKLTEKFNNMLDEEKVDYLKILASSMNDALENIQNERNALLHELKVTKNELANAKILIDNQKKLITQTILDINEDKDSYIKRIRELERMISK